MFRQNLFGLGLTKFLNYVQINLMPKSFNILFRISAIISAFLGYLFASGMALAAPLIKPPPGSVATGIQLQSIPQLVIQYTSYLALILAVLYLMFGGIKLITSRGDKQAVESARKHITYAVIGLVVVLGTFFILNILFNILGTQNPLNTNFTPPTLRNINPAAPRSTP